MIVIARRAQRTLHGQMLALIVAIILVGVVAGVSASMFPRRASQNSPPVRGGSQVTPYTLPTPTASLDPSQVEPAHRALHDLGRACRRPPDRDPERVLRSLDTIERFARLNRDARFPIDDEVGTTLSLLVVVRNELASCAPGLLSRVDALIPSEYRP